MLLHEVDVYSQNELLSGQEKNADVICLLYDSTNSNSFAYCAHIFLRYFCRTKVPCLFVATRAEKYNVEQDYEFQPEDFCRMHQLPKPYYFRDGDIGNPLAEVFTQLATMATYPHLKKLYYARDTYANLFSFAAMSGIIALFGFLWIKSTRG